jgi:hypothetical protein
LSSILCFTSNTAYTASAGTYRLRGNILGLFGSKEWRRVLPVEYYDVYLVATLPVCVHDESVRNLIAVGQYVVDELEPGEFGLVTERNVVINRLTYASQLGAILCCVLSNSFLRSMRLDSSVIICEPTTGLVPNNRARYAGATLAPG